MPSVLSHLRRFATVAASLLAAVSGVASAGEDRSPPVSPERPDVSYNATLVAPGAMQWEMGFDGAIPPVPSTRAALGMPTTFRVGLHRRVELQPFDGDL